MSFELNLPSRKQQVVNSSNDLIFEKQLGQGAFGQVFKAKIKHSGQYIAVKMVKLTRSNLND